MSTDSLVIRDFMLMSEVRHEMGISRITSPVPWSCELYSETLEDWLNTYQSCTPTQHHDTSLRWGWLAPHCTAPSQPILRSYHIWSARLAQSSTNTALSQSWWTGLPQSLKGWEGTCTKMREITDYLHIATWSTPRAATPRMSVLKIWSSPEQIWFIDISTWEHHDLLSELSLSTSSRRFPLKHMIVSENMIFINLYYLEAMIISIHCVQNIQINILLFCTCPQYKLAETFDAGLSIRCLPGSVIGCLILQGQLIHQQRWAWQIHYLTWRLRYLTARALWTNID